jgi:hypothetical protein
VDVTDGERGAHAVLDVLDRKVIIIRNTPPFGDRGGGWL